MHEAQNQDQSRHDGDVKRLKKIVQGIQFAMMTTISSEDASLRTRPMTLQQTEFDGTFWFLTDKSSALVQDIEKNPKVNLAFSDPDDSIYASVSGTAELVEDPEKIEDLWSPMLRAWYPKGMSDPALGLIRVEVESADYWESPSARVVQLVGFAKAILAGKRAGPELGTHRHVNLH
jgi:general stress protein 26